MDASDRLTESERERIARKLDEAWRMRCPHGHSYLHENNGPSVYCHACRERYHYADLVDARASDSSVAVAPPEKREP